MPGQLLVCSGVSLVFHRVLHHRHSTGEGAAALCQPPARPGAAAGCRYLGCIPPDFPSLASLKNKHKILKNQSPQVVSDG